MRPLVCSLLTAVAAQAISVHERAFVAPKAPPRDAPLPASPYHQSGSARPAEIDGAGSGAIFGAGSASRGTAVDSTSPFQQRPESSGKNEELLETAIEAAHQVFDLLSQVIDLTSGDDDDNDQSRSPYGPTAVHPSDIRPTQVASTSDGATNTTASYLLTQNNVTYTFASDPRLLSKDVVIEMAASSPNRLSFQRDLLTAPEYQMFLDDPICFYANVERLYLNASSSSSISLTSQSTTTSPTQLARRQTDCASPGVPGIDPVCTAAAGSPEWSSSQASSISLLWASQLPDQLWSAHFATPTAVSGEVTATVTSTTSCGGLDGGEGVVTRVRVLKTRAGDGDEMEGEGGGDARETGMGVGESVSAGGGMKVSGWIVLVSVMAGFLL